MEKARKAREKGKTMRFGVTGRIFPRVLSKIKPNFFEKLGWHSAFSRCEKSGDVLKFAHIRRKAYSVS